VLIVENSSALESDDVRLFEEIGRRTGLALEHARLYRQAQDANRMKDEFVAIVSHELRTPLTPILGAVYMLRTEPNDPRIATRALDLIERNAKAQSKIVEDLLDVSRIISGKLRLNMETVDLHGVINSAVETVRPASDAKTIQLDVALNPLNGVVYGDADRLQQVAWNLLANAVKFTPNGGTITVKLDDDNTHAELRVSDTGIGIGEEFLPHVFDRFRQADASRTRTHGGLGLGLAIVRHLVESHGGTVHADSSGRERGATFTVKLPLRPAVQEARKASAAF
jgi:signal transduction histidine kinase